MWELVSDGLDYIKVANFEMPSRVVRGVASGSKARTSRSLPACYPAVSVTG